MPQTILLVVVVIAVGLNFLSFWWLHRLRRRFDSAMVGVEGRSLESLLASAIKHVARVDHKVDQLTDSYQKLSTAAGLASQKISVVRFNPFGDTGGDQSFALAVLDAHDSGYVLTSIHGREGTRVYVKPIDYGKSKYTLSKEEQSALEQAAKRVPKE